MEEEDMWAMGMEGEDMWAMDMTTSMEHMEHMGHMEHMVVRRRVRTGLGDCFSDRGSGRWSRAGRSIIMTTMVIMVIMVIMVVRNMTMITVTGITTTLNMTVVTMKRIRIIMVKITITVMKATMIMRKKSMILMTMKWREMVLTRISSMIMIIMIIMNIRAIKKNMKMVTVKATTMMSSIKMLRTWRCMTTVKTPMCMFINTHLPMSTFIMRIMIMIMAIMVTRRIMMKMVIFT